MLLPLGATEHLIEKLFATMHKTLCGVGVILVGGHTEVTSAVNRLVILGPMLGLDEDGYFVATAGVAPGDAVVQVGSVPIEAAAVLAVEDADRLVAVPPQVIAAARQGLHDPGISVVDTALAAHGLGATDVRPDRGWSCLGSS